MPAPIRLTPEDAAFVLTGAELQTAVALKLRGYAEAELFAKRMYNDGTTLNDVETALVRGQIKQLKRVLELLGVAA